MLKWLLAPFVGVLLVFHLSVFILKLIWGLYPTQILASVTLIVALILSVAYIQASGILNSPLPLLDTSHLRAEQARWTALAQEHPTHRDILINAALLEKALNNQERATQYWQKAWEQDPNFPLFTTYSLESPLPSSSLSKN